MGFGLEKRRPGAQHHLGDRNIWLVGGAMLSQRFLELGLVDEIRLTIAPVLSGDGLRLFGGCRGRKGGI